MESGGGARFRHIEINREELSAERRRRPFFAPPPDRGGRALFAPKLIQAAERLEIDQNSRSSLLPRGLKPHLIFRIPVTSNAPRESLIALLEQAGLVIVSLEPDDAVVAFRELTDLSEFKNAALQYQAGPTIDPRTGLTYKSTKYDVLEFVEPEQMRLLLPRDRIGEALATLIGDSGSDIVSDQIYTVEAELWHPGNKLEARKLVDEVREFIRERGNREERFLDSYVGDYLVIVKVKVKGDGLRLLIDVNIVATLELPPKAEFDPIQIRALPISQFPEPQAPPQNGPKVCVLDSGLTTNHPLIRRHVGHAQSFLTSTRSESDAHGHGTLVAGIAVFGDVLRSIERRRFDSPVTVLSARVLNEHNEFEDEKLIINQLKEVFEVFVAHPFYCRVFNLSVGRREAASEVILGRQTLWAEQLDILAKDLSIIIVVSTGNTRGVLGASGSAAEEIIRDYPAYLFADHARLADPASAAIAITVGGIVEREELSALPTAADDIRRIIGRANFPSPITRCGPGVNGAIKPELVHFAGGLILGGFGSESMRVVAKDPAMGVTSFSNNPTQSLFAFDVGTSFAAPRVSRLAALVFEELKSILGQSPSPNTVRAILSNAAEIPSVLDVALNAHGGFPAAVKACGYGLPAEDRALTSAEKRVTIFSEESLKLDYFHVYKIPVPKQFIDAKGLKEISISLAFDPPVRRRRLDYLGVEMDFLLLRGMTIKEVTDACRRLQPNEDLDTSIENSFKVKLVPSSTSRSGFSRKKSTL